MTTWTAETLHAATQGHEVKPWWPEGLGVSTSSRGLIWDVKGVGYVLGWAILPNHAADLILASAVRWLVNNNGGSWVMLAWIPNSELVCVPSSDKIFQIGQRNAPTLLQVVLAACLAVEEAGLTPPKSKE